MADASAASLRVCASRCARSPPPWTLQAIEAFNGSILNSQKHSLAVRKQVNMRADTSKGLLNADQMIIYWCGFDKSATPLLPIYQNLPFYIEPLAGGCLCAAAEQARCLREPENPRMTSLFRRLVSSGAGTVLVAVVALSITSHSHAAHLRSPASQMLQAVTASTQVADLGPLVAHHWPT